MHFITISKWLKFGQTYITITFPYVTHLICAMENKMENHIDLYIY